MRHAHWLLRLLKLRVIVNDHDIYECKEKQPVIINCTDPITRITVINGFHSSRKVIVKNKPGIKVYEIASYIDNVQLLTGIIMALLFFFIYIFSGLRFFMFFANVPILIMLYIFYIKRSHFIQIHVLKQGKDH